MKNKEANFQLLKIAAMLMIVSHHIVAKNMLNVDTQIVGITLNKLALQVLGNNAFIGNNLFFLVSAWFLSKKNDESVCLNYSMKSCFRIEKTVLFYSIAMCIAMTVLGLQSKTALLGCIFPTMTGVWWYPTTYIVFLLIWPFYHRALMWFSDDSLKQFTLVILSVWSLTSLIPFVNLGASNLITFFMLYAVVIVVRRLNITFEDHKFKFICFMIIPYCAAIISIIVLDLLGSKITAAAQYSCYFMRGNYRPVSMMVSVGLFMWGTSWKIKSNRMLDYLAEATFGIYLFHMYPTMSKLLFERVFSLQDIIYKPYAVVYLVIATLAIFVAGLLIDSIRRLLFFVCSFLVGKIRVKNESACC